MIEQNNESTKALIDSIVAVARDWIDVEYPLRVEAEERTLASENRFTAEALAFAVNQQMSLLTVDALSDWQNRLQATSPCTVGVLNAGNVPFVGLQDFIAVVLSGHRYAGTVSSRSPYLLPALATDLGSRHGRLQVRFLDFEPLLKEADALIATGSDETAILVLEAASRSGIARDRILVRGHRYSIGITDGKDSDDERIALAEDMLLHEGLGCRSLAILWAPADTSPDPYLDAMARFRSLFPAHSSTPGTLKLQQAFLKAVDQPYAFGEGLVFLLSRGEPEAQSPGHIRWAEYGEIEDVETWIDRHSDEIQLVIASERVKLSVPESMNRTIPGEAQRPELDWCQGSEEIGSFLQRL